MSRAEELGLHEAVDARPLLDVCVVGWQNDEIYADPSARDVMWSGFWKQGSLAHGQATCSPASFSGSLSIRKARKKSVSIGSRKSKWQEEYLSMLHLLYAIHKPKEGGTMGAGMRPKGTRLQTEVTRRACVSCSTSKASFNS